MNSRFVTSPGPEIEAFAQNESVAVHQADVTRAITPWRDLKAIVKLRRWFNNNKPVIVHSHTPKGGLVGMIAAFLASTPVRVYHIRGLPFDTAKGLRRRLLWLSEKVSCMLAHRVLCVSHSMKRIAVESRLCAEDKIVVFGKGSGNGVDASRRFDPSHISHEQIAEFKRNQQIPLHSRVVGFVGRVARDKGMNELAQAWQKIRSVADDAYLLIVGPMETNDPMDQELLRQLESDDRVRFAGRVDDTSTIYASVDVFVLPTYREGFPNTVLEAMAMALPVVATKIPGCVDAIEDGITGTLIPPQNSEAIARAVRAYLNDPLLAARHGHAARAHVVEHFVRERIWNSTLNEYRELLAERVPNIALQLDEATVVTSLHEAA